MFNLQLIRKIVPTWLIFVIDICISFVSITTAYLVRFNFHINIDFFEALPIGIPLLFVIRALSFILGRTYAGLIRYTTTKDAERIFAVIFLGTVTLMIFNVININFGKKAFIPFSILIIDFFVNFFLMISLRVLVKVIYQRYFDIIKYSTNVVIYGADQFGLSVKRTLDRDTNSRYRVSAFIDDTSIFSGKFVDGVNIYHVNKIDMVLKKFNISHVIIAKRSLSKSQKHEIIESFLDKDIKILQVPDMVDWINGELNPNQIRNIKIEELLERDVIKLDDGEIRQLLLDKTILVTGAAGSIGSQIVRELTNYSPKLIVLLDNAESPLYEIEIELNENLNRANFEIVIGDITNPVRMNKIFDVFRPSIVYHAAAYKHVPMMENNPTESVRVNVLGTKIISDLSVKFDVSEFVMISTDKAVNPTNIMGASKRIAEIYTQSLNRSTKTNFVTTRFGNVLGSNGSVILRFKKQIENGGPVTVTHPDVTRYFMTIPEACQLVLEASAMGKGGEIFIFDMGKSVKIADLARKMIKLSGLTPNKDIQMNFTGLRPGEKLYEELLNDKEKNIATYHPQIMIAKVLEYDLQTIENNIAELAICINEHDNIKLVKLMKTIVPEFVSQNSVYEKLDGK